LLTNFLVQNLVAKKVDWRRIKRLLDDNMSTKQKFERLFPSVVGLKWEMAINSLSRKHSVDYAVVSLLMKEVAKQRNVFLHEGRPWQISGDISKRCINSLLDWISLFVDLHNEYTQPFWGHRE
jgi:hypothetical protein